MKAVIKYLNPKKAPGYDFITNQILQKLLEMGIKNITQLCNAVLRQGFFLSQWKMAQIIMIQKPGKPTVLTVLTESSRPMSLLPILSKLFEKFLSRISIIMSHGLILDYQFGFRSKHTITEQIHRIIKRINNDMEAGRYCLTVFLELCRLSTTFDIENYFIKSKIYF